MSRDGAINVYSQCTCTRTEYQIRITALHNAQRILTPQNSLWYVNAEFVFCYFVPTLSTS